MHDSRDVLRFWRDVEIFNIPTVPVLETKENVRVATFRPEAPLPWQKGHRGFLADTATHKWVHAVFIGVSATRDWAVQILETACRAHRLSDADLERLSGKGWAAAFAVNGVGEVAAESYLPASFVLGIRNIRAGKSLDGIALDIADQVEAFKERRSPATELAVVAVPAETATSEPTSASTPSLPPLGWPELNAEWSHIQGLLGKMAPSCVCVVIKSVRTKIKKDGDVEEADVEFLNSFYLNDLDRLIAQADRGAAFGKALQQYLGPQTKDTDRQDILLSSCAMERCLSPEKLAYGRWPEKSKYHLMLGQQAAVGEIFSTLANGSGLVAVNGPPGTGKTTLLRDVVAGVVVRRALALANLKHPAQAFAPRTVVGGLSFFPMKPELVAGTGIVVTSNNNKAVENISKELPELKNIAADEHPEAGYLTDVANRVLQKEEKPAWGLVAAALGNSANRGAFARAFFWDRPASTYTPGTPSDIKTVLEAAHQDSLQHWQEAKEKFLAIFSGVEMSRKKLIKVRDLMVQAAELRLELARFGSQREAAAGELSLRSKESAAAITAAEAASTRLQADLSQAKRLEYHAGQLMQGATDRVEAAAALFPPRWWDRWLKALGWITSRWREWEDRLRDLKVARADAIESWNRASGNRSKLEGEQVLQQQKLEEMRGGWQREREALEQSVKELEERIKDRERLCRQCEKDIHAFKKTGATVPDAEFFQKEAGKRHLESAWVTPDFDLQRARLFVAALQLHEATIKACKKLAIPNFRVVTKMLSGEKTPEPIAANQRGQVWDALFFTVPVVSTTLASFDRLFTGIRPESLGWLLIDEAGQATPQSVAGALWRSRRAVIIGDPRQVEPVLTVPLAVIAELRGRHGVPERWSPAKESAQTLADNTMIFGARIGNPKSPDAVWTGLPLRAHRRCIDPMFAVANDIAYENQMVQANLNPVGISSSLGDSAWFNVQGVTSDRQLVHEEMKCLLALLERLKNDWPQKDDGKPAEVFVISPFRTVAEHCWKTMQKVDIPKETGKIDCGTVHRFQGREAEVVFLVLGSAPGKAGFGSRNWASASPNILNVALTRAKSRIYVVGNFNDWKLCPSFAVLATYFQKTGRVLDNWQDV